MILWLFLITAVVVVVTGTLLSVFEIAVHGHQFGIIEGIWQNMRRSFEPAAMEADTGWPLRLQSLLVVLVGILVVSSLIGLIASGIDRRVEEMRKGRSEVIEQGHVLILGWSEKIFPIIAELVLAHRGRRASVVVVMADHDKIEMEDAIKARVRHLGHARVVCRRGDPSNPADLALVSPYESGSVIALGNNHRDGDAQVIRTVLARVAGAEDSSSASGSPRSCSPSSPRSPTARSSSPTCSTRRGRSSACVPSPSTPTRSRGRRTALRRRRP